MAGLGVAWSLSRLGVNEVVVLDAGTPGQQATARSSGGIRRQFATAIEITLTTLSLPFFEEAFASPDFSGGGLKQLGYAFLAGERDAAALAAAWALQQEMAVPSQWLEPDQIRSRFPYLDATGLRGGTFSPEDGFVDPWALHQWLLRDCRRRGITVLADERVLAIESSARRVSTVRTATRNFEPESVVNAAGAWARSVSRLAGSDVAIDPSPRVKLVTDLHPPLPADMPLTTDLETGAYVRSESGAAMVGVKPDRAVIGFEIDTSPDLLAGMARRASVRFPSLVEARLAHLVTGLYEVTADGLPVAGADPTLKNLFVLGGFNGHGIMHSPALARALAESIVLGAPKDLDLGELSPQRLTEAPAAGRDLL